MKSIDQFKKYKIGGQFLYLIFLIKELYEMPIMINDKGQLFPNEQLHFYLGQLIAEFEKLEWEEIKNEK